MKRNKLCVAAAVFWVILCFCMIFSGCAANNIDGEGKLLRVHIRANSDSEADQTVKTDVKEAVVQLLEDRLKNAVSLSDAIDTVKSLKSRIESVADDVLRKNGFGYTSKAQVSREYFPTRVYESVIVESGVYDALIIELGAGAGDNWWCVIYPPLCFVGRQPGEGEVHYKSRIAEWLRRFISLSS